MPVQCPGDSGEHRDLAPAFLELSAMWAMNRTHAYNSYHINNTLFTIWRAFCPAFHEAFMVSRKGSSPLLI